MNNAPLATGEVGLPDRPTDRPCDRPWYVRLAGTIPNSHTEHWFARRFSSVRISRSSPQISFFALCDSPLCHPPSRFFLRAKARPRRGRSRRPPRIRAPPSRRPPLSPDKPQGQKKLGSTANDSRHQPHSPNTRNETTTNRERFSSCDTHS